MHNIILEGKLNLELSRKLCTTDQVCIMCVEFTDFHVYSEEDEYALVHTNAEGCLSFFTFCIAPGMGSSIDFGCFDFEDTSLSHCSLFFSIYLEELSFIIIINCYYFEFILLNFISIFH